MGGCWSLLASCSEKAGSQKGKRRVGDTRTRALLQQRGTPGACGSQVLTCCSALVTTAWPQVHGRWGRRGSRNMLQGINSALHQSRQAST